MHTLQDRLKQARKLSGLSQGKAAKAVGLASHQQILAYENGTREPDVEMIVKLAGVYGVKSACLLPDGPMPGEPDTLDTDTVLQRIDGLTQAVERLRTDLTSAGGTASQAGSTRTAASTIYNGERIGPYRGSPTEDVAPA